MAELQKLIQSKGSESSELMKLYLSEAQHSFLEHSKKQNKMSNVSNLPGSLVGGTLGSPNPNISNNTYLLSTNNNNNNLNNNTTNNNNNNSNLMTTTNLTQHQQQLLQSSPADINLNVRPPSSGNLNMPGTPGDLLNTGSPSSSLHAPSPFLDLGVADLSPLPGGINLNLGFDNMCLPNPGDSLNGNSVYSPSNQSLPDNLSNSPMIMPNLDNLDPCSPSEFFTGNMTTTSSVGGGGLSGLATPDSGTSPHPGAGINTTNLNNNNMNLNTSNYQQQQLQQQQPIGASVCPPLSSGSSLDNLNINTNLMGTTTTQGGINANTQQLQYPNLLSPNSIKKEPTDTSCLQSPQQQQTHPHQTQQIKTEPLSVPPSSSSSVTPEPTDMFTSLNRLSDVERVLAEAQMTPEASRLLLLNQVTDIIVEAHMGTTINTHANVAAAKERIAGRKLDPNDMLPDMSRLSLSATDLWQQFLTALVPEITKVVKFSKKLPAFSDFPQTDQIKLIKQGAFEVMVARYSILVDEVNEIMLDPKLEMMSPRRVIGDLPMGPFLDEFFTIAKQFNPLRLSDGEIGLFTAILMICPDRQGLENRDAISRIQDLILQALYLLMKQNTTRTESAETTFRSLIGMISHFRKVNDDHARFLNNIKMRSPSDFNQQFPALHQEVFDDSIKKTEQSVE